MTRLQRMTFVGVTGLTWTVIIGETDVPGWLGLAVISLAFLGTVKRSA